ncbi:MAG: sulfur carrier protein ThiS [Acidobacteria bacterium]|nr:sulfur carrier protein ThiS [Acidobacteriota bacterium]
MITIKVNGVSKDLDQAVTLTELLEKLDLPTRRVAIELNKNVVSRSKWQEVCIEENDELEIIHFVGGG